HQFLAQFQAKKEATSRRRSSDENEALAGPQQRTTQFPPQRTMPMPASRQPHTGALPPKLLAAAATAIVVLTAAAAWTRFSRSATRAGAGAGAPQFGPTILNASAPPGAAPAGMVWIPGGEFSMGAQDAPDGNEVAMNATRDSRPIHRVYVDGFFMDTTDVT